MQTLVGKLAIGGALLAALAVAGCDSNGIGGDRMSGSFVATNRLTVVPLSGPNDFEVLATGGTGGSQYFCAAGDYAFRRLNAPPAYRVVVTRPESSSISQPGRRGVGFTVVPQGATPGSSGFAANVRSVGANYSVSHSQLLCNSLSSRSDF